MALYRFLRDESENYGFEVVFMTALSGLVNGLLIGILIGAPAQKSGEASVARSFFLFLVLLAIFTLSKRYVVYRNLVVAEEITRRVRLRISDKIRRVDLEHFEQVETTELYSLMSARLHMICASARSLAISGSSAIMIAFALVYIAIRSQPAFILTAVVIGFGILYFRDTESKAAERIAESMEVENDFFEKVERLIQGIKEVRISIARSDDLFENHLVVLSKRNEAIRVRADRYIADSITLGNSVFIILIGAIVFVVPLYTEVDPTTVIQVASVILFIMGPIQSLVESLPFFAQGETALAQLKALEVRLDEAIAVADDIQGLPDRFGPFENLSCRGLTFRYGASYGASGTVAFQVGPVDLQLERGEVVFLIGGNGTGKSTFIKLLCALYKPTSGMLSMNGEMVLSSDLPHYRERFAVIYQDYHLFDRIYGTTLSEEQLVRKDRHLRELDLDTKTKILKDGTITNLALSSGQKKRLALVTAELEDPEIFILDEWAADQDPPRRQWFYERFLPELKAAGKLVLVATHDDAYFDKADRWLRVRDGNLTEMTWVDGRLEPLSDS